MIEIHCHLLPNVDDGVRSFEEAINTIKKMKELGYEEICITPHYIKGTSYTCNNENKLSLLKELQDKLEENNIDIKLYLGNEIFVDENIKELIQKEEVYTINNSKYVFIELPRNDSINKIEDIIFSLKSKGLIPIIAHPERYMIFKSDYDLLYDFIDRGVLFQVNFESISGKYGKDSKKLAKYILKHNLATLLGGDVHHDTSIFFKNYKKNKKKIIKLIKEDKFNELISINPKKILNNEEIK